MPVAYPISCRVSFDEYVKMLFRQSPVGRDEKKWQNRAASTHLLVAQKVFDQALERESVHELDSAYVMFCRVVHIAEGAQSSASDSERAKLRTLMKKALDREENLRLKRLPLFLEEQVCALEAVEVERKRIVLLQMEKDSSDDEEEQAAHEERRRKLLATNNAQVVNFPTVVDHSFHALRQQQLHEQEQTEAAKLRSLLTGAGETQPRVNILPLAMIAPVLPSPVQPVLPSPMMPSSSQPAPSSQTPVKPRRREQWRFERGESTHFRRGLVNLGNTCYLNSILQCLAQSELGAYAATNEFVDEITDRSNSNLMEAFSFAMRELSSSVVVPVNAARLKFEVGKLNESFAGKSQQDANELLRTLLDGIHEELNAKRGIKLVLPEIDNRSGTDEELAKQHWAQYKARNASLVVNLFAFQERSTLACPRCKFISRSFSPTLGIDVPIPLGNDTSVEECLAAYCNEETVDGITCSNCDKKVAVRKQLSLHSTPRNLVITLKRFRSQGNFADKIQSPVFFQETIDVSPFVTGSQLQCQYKLIGVVNHQGNIHGGHYTADSCGARDGLWSSCSDEVVQPSLQPNFKLAYILFYMRME